MTPKWLTCNTTSNALPTLILAFCPKYCHIKHTGNSLNPGGGGTSSNFRYPGSACKKKKRTQSDLRFCENEGSKRFKINDKGGQLDRKLMENLYKMLKIGLKIPKTGVITVEPPYHAQVWVSPAPPPHPGEDFVPLIVPCHVTNSYQCHKTMSADNWHKWR